MTNDSAGIKVKAVRQAEGLEIDIKERESTELGPSWLWSEKRGELRKASLISVLAV